MPLALVALLLVVRCLPADRPRPAAAPAAFDARGTVLLALALAAYALAMTLGRGHVGSRNVVLLAAAVAGMGLFVASQAKAASPLIRLALFRDARLSAGLGMSGLVATVMMATLVVGPFYLSRALGLGSARVGLVMSIGPIMVAFTGVPAGRLVDRLGARRMTVLGLVAMTVGSALLALIPATFGVSGYLAPIIAVTLGYGVFQTANNTAIMKDVRPEQRGVVSGLLNLSRNLGLITGIAVLGAVFAHASGTSDVAIARPAAVATGMRTTFSVAGLLVVIALAVAVKTRMTNPEPDRVTAPGPPSRGIHPFGDPSSPPRPIVHRPDL